jgi:hypothetical protein
LSRLEALVLTNEIPLLSCLFCDHPVQASLLALSLGGIGLIWPGLLLSSTCDCPEAAPAGMALGLL